MAPPFHSNYSSQSTLSKPQSDCKDNKYSKLFLNPRITPKPIKYILPNAGFDRIITKARPGDQFVSIDGKRTYFDIGPSRAPVATRARPRVTGQVEVALKCCYRLHHQYNCYPCHNCDHYHPQYHHYKEKTI